MPGLRFHDLRHHAITELAESGASEQTIMAIAGHVSQRMLEHYSHIRRDAKRRALDGLSSRLSEGTKQVGAEEGSYGTRGDTNKPAGPVSNPEVIEKTGGRHGIRTHGLLVAKVIWAKSKLWPALLFCDLAGPAQVKSGEFCCQVAAKFCCAGGVIW